MNDYSWTDLFPGQAAGFESDVSADMLTTFADLSGDYNPLHTDAEFAHQAGFPGRVVYGMLTAALYSRLVGMYLPGKHALLHQIDVEFKSPAYIGDHLSVSGEIAYLNDAYRRLEIKARIVNQDGKLISKAAIRAGLHEK